MTNLKLKHILLMFFFFFCFVARVYPISSFSADNSVTNNVLIIYDNFFDHTLAQELQVQCPEGNYTLFSTNELTNISNFFLTANLAQYNSIILILSNSVNDIEQIMVEKLQNYFTNDGSLTMISSKIWQLPASAQELFGIESPTGGFQEFVPNTSENFTLFINNETYLQNPYRYSVGNSINLTSRLGIINKASENVIEIMTSNSFDIGQNKTTKSGIFLKESDNSSNLILSIPISIYKDTNNESIKLISSLSYYLVDWSILVDSKNESSQNQQNSINLFNLNLSSNDVQTLAVIGGISILGVVSYKTIPFLRKKEDLDSIEDLTREEIWSPDDSWITSILMFFLGILVSIGAIIYSQRYRRLTVFQVNENPIRQQIIEILDENGFEHFNSLQKKLDTGVSILLWHLEVLEDFEIIKMEKIGQYKLIYLVDKPPDSEEVFIYSKVRSKIAIDILNQFTRRHTWNTYVLSQLLVSSQELIKYHCKKLASLKILAYNQEEKSYSLDETKITMILKLINRYSASFE